MNRSTTLKATIATTVIDEQLPVTSSNSLNASVKIISGLKMNWCHFRLRISLMRIIIKAYSNPLHWVLALKYLIRLRKNFLGDFKLKKMIKVDSKYYMGLYTPGWNDDIYKRFITSELNNFKVVKSDVLRFNHVYVAVTKKCPLQCDHCYAWDILNKKEQLSPEDLKCIIGKLQDMGTAQIHLTGGEPLIKPRLLFELLATSQPNTNFWINTSGYKLTNERAKDLKNAGLTGLFISLDHFDEETHNNFRKYKDAYYWAVNGAGNAVANNLVVALSLCVLEDFISEENLMTYMKLAKDLGVPFVQFLEPKEVGHFDGKQVSISSEKIEILESFYVKMNFSDDYLDFPIINYHGYYQRRQGCYAGGNRSMYVDTDGNLNACPFCHTNSGNMLDDSFENQLRAMTKLGCPIY
ncbi:MAG: radical SAM/SPASM domain-containing protein [Psychroserpens sp.]|uniref:radical SAM/SPASM domain-containing protein n=1 Tax=Psychroserpens sp. TaxID=2020870 RepID=UPI0030022E9F